jgi:DNA-directed RNA polymerase subunit RPC12/RpoP
MSASITRNEFIDAYMARSRLGRGAERRTPFGFTNLESGTWIALPCDCDYEGCQGWAMMPNALSTVAVHCDVHLPPGHEALVFQMRCARCAATWALPCDRTLMDKIVDHEIVCPGCGSGDFINHLMVESYSEGQH